jgi:hypothetical protein
MTLSNYRTDFNCSGLLTSKKVSKKPRYTLIGQTRPFKESAMSIAADAVKAIKKPEKEAEKDGVGDRPVRKFRVGNVTAAVWKNDGNFSVSLQKSYKDGEDWKDTDTLFHGDILNAIKALERAEDFIAR